jgi:hypothetical protein
MYSTMPQEPSPLALGQLTSVVTKEPVIRELESRDLPDVAEILSEGFPSHSLDVWRRRLRVLAERDPAPGTSRFGYGLDVDGLQGVGLTIGSLHGPPLARQTIVNGASWTVRPAHRGLAAIQLFRRCVSGAGMTFSNLTAGVSTREMVKICGFKEHTKGVVVGVGVARPRGRKRQILSLSDAERAGLSPERFEMMRYHEARGCLVFCVEETDRVAPFMFKARPLRAGVPLAQLIYCERLGDLIDNSRAITLELWKRGCVGLLVDASAPIEGLKGRFFPGLEPKYYKGPAPIYAIDHSYSELVYFAKG